MLEQKRKTLTLHEKVQVIKHKKKTQCGARELARVFQVGKTQIQTILKNEHRILKQFKDNDPGECKRKIRKTGNEEINKLTWAWFKDVTAQKLPVCGQLLQERVLKFATDLRNNDFKASNGWLDSFCRRHDIAFVRRCGESGDVDSAIVDDWKQKLPSLLGYDPKDVFNMDETGLFFVLGEKVNPLVIWRYANPHCFKGIKKDKLSVGYYSNKIAWITSGVFETWLKKLNHKMAFE